MIFPLIILLSIINFPGKIALQDNSKITYLDLNKDFPFLDENYRYTNVSSQLFDSIVQLYNFKPKSFKKYNDSLALMLVHKHKGNWSESRKEIYAVTFTWEYISYYFLLSPEKTQTLGEKINVRFPSDLLKYFKDDKVQSPIKSENIERIKKELFNITNDMNVLELDSNKEILYYAFNLRSRERHKNAHQH